MSCVLLSAALSTSIAIAASSDDPSAAGPVVTSGVYKTIPLQTWKVDSRSFAGQLSSRHGTTKAATDLASVYRPITPCRLIDTRGFSAAIAVAGPLAPNSTTNINAAGFCGIPNNSEVAGISLSFHVFNNTVNNGGYIAFQQQGAAVTGVNAVFNPGAQWTAATANVSIPNDTGNFSIFIANSQVQVIIDVNGYYQDLNFLDVGTQELDIVGNATGDLFELNNAGTGTALGLSSNGDAIRVYSGSVRASGAGVGTNTFATIHQVNTAGNFGAGGTLCAAGFPSYSVIDNDQANGDPNAILFITPRYNSLAAQNVQYEAYYYTSGSCVAAANNHWMVRKTDGTAYLNTSRFNILVIKP